MDRKEIKSVARQALKNDRWLPVGVGIVAVAIDAASWGILTGPISYGVHEYFLNSLKGKEAKFTDLFAGFKHFGKTFLCVLLMGLYTCLWGLIPLAGPIIMIVKGFSYSQSLLLLRDHPELSANQAITKSREIMNGHKGQLFGLYLSFLGWMIVDCFTCFILGTLFIQPYMQFALMEFHERVK